MYRQFMKMIAKPQNYKFDLKPTTPKMCLLNLPIN